MAEVRGPADFARVGFGDRIRNQPNENNEEDKLWNALIKSGYIQPRKEEEDKLELNEYEILNSLEWAYDMINSILRDYCDLSEEYYHIVTLWILGTYVHDCFDTFPLLFINATRGGGKSRLVKLIGELSHNGETQTDISEAVLFRTAKGHTLILDEFEHIGSKEKGVLRTLLNAAYKKGFKVQRMKKIKQFNQERQVVEEFDLYVPIAMANIWGIEEVLADRCITLTLEKSNNKAITKTMEDYKNNPFIKLLKKTMEVLLVQLCSYFREKNLSNLWNFYVKMKYNYTKYTHTLTTLTTLTTSNQPNRLLDSIKSSFNFDKPEISAKTEEVFDKIHNLNIDGRNLEIFFPIIMLSSVLSKNLFDKTLKIAKEITNEKKTEESIESRDVMLINFVASHSKIEWYDNFVLINDITHEFRSYVHDDEENKEWLNSRWLGRALKRLKLTKEKRRMRRGMEVILNVEKAKEKSMIFHVEEKIVEDVLAEAPLKK